MKVTSKIAIVLASVVAAASITGVSATWYYKLTKADPASESVDIDVGNYRWAGESLLPTTEGYNQLALIEILIDALNGTYDGSTYTTLLENMSYRNSPDWAYLYNYEGRNYIGSMDRNTQLTAASELVDSDTENLSFIIAWDSYNNRTGEYANLTIYTTNVYLGEGGKSGTYATNRHYTTEQGITTIPFGDYVYCVYKTEVTYTNGTYAATNTTEGKAPICWYEESQRIGACAKQEPSFDYTNWEEATLGTDIGTSMSDAIWTFDGDSAIVALSDTVTYAYYKMVPEGTITRTYSETQGTGTGQSGTINFTLPYDWNAEGSYALSTTAYNAAITIYKGTIETPDGSEEEIASMKRQSSATTTIVGDATTVVTTVVDTYIDENGWKTVYTYTVTDVTVDGTTTETIKQTVDEYLNVDDPEPAATSESEIYELPSLSMYYTATSGNYYYFKVEGNTNIPLELT